MNPDLPLDLLNFLREGRQLEYDVGASQVGAIRLRGAADLAVTTITASPGCQSTLDDPYENLEGEYQIDVYDLVAEAEDYDAAGLLCWIVALKCLGCVDPEHGDVISFPKLTWTDLVADPLPYLDAQWNADDDAVGVRVLPWLHFPFKFTDVEGVLRPYGAQCPVHGSAVVPKRTRRPPLFEAMQAREADDWLQKCMTAFPCAGVPVSGGKLLCCPECRAAENAWVRHIEKSMAPAEVVPYMPGWVQCPSCGFRFSITDASVFKHGVHLRCGQRIRVVTAG